jgi:hypothetical protein
LMLALGISLTVTHLSDSTNPLAGCYNRPERFWAHSSQGLKNNSSVPKIEGTLVRG